MRHNKFVLNTIEGKTNGKRGKGDIQHYETKRRNRLYRTMSSRNPRRSAVAKRPLDQNLYTADYSRK